MEDQKIKESLAMLGEEIVKLDHKISKLLSSVAVLKIWAAAQTSPQNPEEFLKVLQASELKIQELDPTEPERKKTLETIEALKLWKKHGGGGSA